MKIRTKIALVFTLMTGTILFLLSAFVYVVSSEHMEEHFLTRLKVSASIAAESEFEDETNLVREIRDRHLQKLRREKEWFFEDNSAFPREVLKALPRAPKSFIENLMEGGSAASRQGFEYYTGFRYQSASTNGKQYFVIASAYDEDGEETLLFLRTMLIIGFSVSCVLVFALGRLFANRIMKPIADIISKVHEITKTNLSERLGSAKGNDEIAEMAATFNNMLDRLETTFELQSNFIGNASHELNTPLTAILGEVEIIRSAPRSPEEYVESLGIIDYEAKKLRDVTSSLLRLSSISYEGKKQKIERLQLDELLMDIKINFDRRMPANKVRMLVQAHEGNTTAYCIVGSSVWLELAITNVIQNSIKYSDNKEVLVTLSSSEQHCFIEISDQGIGIPEEDMRYVFEPFFRGSNTGPYKGYGIGLPLAARIVRLHAGELQIFSKPNTGTKVTLKFNASRDL